MPETKETPLRDLIRAELDHAAQEGRAIPSIRTLRATVQRGSFTAITAFVKEWRLEHAPKTDVKPDGFDEASGKALSDAVWRIISPAVAARMAAVQKAADERIAVEREEAAKIASLAEEKLREAEAKESEFRKKDEAIRRLREASARLEGELAAARRDLEASKADYERLNSALNQSIEREAFATATLEAFQKMFPMTAKPAPAASQSDKTPSRSKRGA